MPPAKKRAARPAGRRSAPAAAKKRPAGKKTGKTPEKKGGVLRRLGCLLILALLGVGSWQGYVYREPLRQIWRQGAAAWERWRDPDKTFVIASWEDSRRSPYDNLDLGIPKMTDTVLDRRGYALGFDRKTMQARWVSYKLTREELNAPKQQRADDFRPDPAIPGGSADCEDYRRSGFDRGHLAPAADMAFSARTMSESFYMSNMSPQRPKCNRGVWKDLESLIRDIAREKGSLYIVTGPVFAPDETELTIGAHQVAVPRAYYKVLCTGSGPGAKAIGFVVPNAAGTEDNLWCYATTVDAVEEATGLDFFSELPHDLQITIEGEFNTAPFREP